MSSTMALWDYVPSYSPADHLRPIGGKPAPYACERCGRKSNKVLSAKRKAERAAASAKVVKKCHRCGRTFVERPMPKRTCSSLSALYSHRYCPSCTWAMKRAARICDPRYASVGGHSDILETGR